ncbi:glycosyltransferase [Azospirillum doebereinerae]
MVQKHKPWAKLTALERMAAAGRFDECIEPARALLGDPACHMKAVILLARCAAGQSRFGEALRWAGRAHRGSPADSSVGTFYGALLIADGQPSRAVPVLAEAFRKGQSAETGAALTQALTASGLNPDAVRHLSILLDRFPVSRTPLLRQVADRMILDGAAPGWVSCEAGDRLEGTLPLSWFAPDDPIRLLADGRELLRMEASAFVDRFGHIPADGTPNGALAGFALSFEAGLHGADIALLRGESPFLGAPTRLRPRPAEVEGVVDIEGAQLRGWARLVQHPERPVAVVVRDEAGRAFTIPADRTSGSAEIPDDGSPPDFSIDLETTGLAPGWLEVGAGPDRTPLAGSRLRWIDTRAALRGLTRLSRSVRRPDIPCQLDAATVEAVVAALERAPSPVQPTRPVMPPRPFRTDRRTDIVIPVYKGHAETLACLDSVLASGAVPAGCELVVIDDASPEPALVRDLRALAAAGRITLLRNERNLGFPATVNRGFDLHPDRDVIVLNADTVVSGDWAGRLRRAAYAAHDVGTVTPLSNNATILSYPSSVPAGARTGNDEPPPLTADQAAALDCLASETNTGLWIEIPTAVGFCMYVRRDCLDEAGGFSEDRFSTGYGEENDFCMRARRLGWRHLAATDTLVAHVGGRSFGSRKALLLARNLRILNQLHPGYDTLIRDFLKRDPLIEARRRLDLARWPREDSQGYGPATLLVTLDLGGGVERHVRGRCATLRAAGRRALLLEPVAAADGTPERCRIVDPQHEDLQDLVFSTAAELDRLVAVLRLAGVEAVEFHHLLNHDPILLTLPDRLGVPHEVVVHDYSWICPRITLIDGSGRYCGEPDAAVCDSCVEENGSRYRQAVPVEKFRQRAAGLLGSARRVVVASRDAAARIARHVPAASLTIEPWEPPLPIPDPPLYRRAAGRWRVGLVGAIGRHKGYDILLGCAADAASRDLPLEFVVVGYSQDDAPLFATGRVFVTGRFAEGEAEGLLRENAIDLVFLPSVWPETWCYALSDVWRAGLEAVAFDLGTIAERIRERGRDHLLPPTLGVAAINDALLDCLESAPTPIPVSPNPVASIFHSALQDPQ